MKFLNKLQGGGVGRRAAGGGRAACGGPSENVGAISSASGTGWPLNSISHHLHAN